MSERQPMKCTSTRPLGLALMARGWECELQGLGFMKTAGGMYIGTAREFVFVADGREYELKCHLVSCLRLQLHPGKQSCN
mmetsp:Transcript_46596/g.129610  ORF Transcript_46596/g.129610 Transcript_46596/m.129610 type:complete len:80 (-) Transcript_46596:117-356(-)